VRERDRLEVGHSCERRWVTVEIPRSTKPRREAPDRRSLVAKPTAKPSDQIGEAPMRESRERGVGLCKREERGGRGFVRMSFGKWFTENISVNCFPKIC
jgi:hypothetical protein